MKKWQPGTWRAGMGALFLLVFGAVVEPAYAQQSKPKKPPPIDQSATDALQDIRIRDLESRVESSYAQLNCNTGSFDSLTMGTPRLLLFAACKNIETFMEGHRLTVEIGNPHTFAFGGISGELKYGKDWAERSVNISFPGDLGSGRWTSLTVVINPSKPEDLRTLHIYLNAKTVIPSR